MTSLLKMTRWRPRGLFFLSPLQPRPIWSTPLSASKVSIPNLPCLCLPGEPYVALLHRKELPQLLLTWQSWAPPSNHASPEESSATHQWLSQDNPAPPAPTCAVSGDPSSRETKAADPLMDWLLPFPPPPPCPALTASGTVTQSLPCP